MIFDVAIATLPPGFFSTVFSLVFDGKTMFGAVFSFVVILLVYLIFPLIKTDKQNKIQKDKEFREWLITKTDKLEEEREKRMKRVEDENKTLSEKIESMESKIRFQSDEQDQTQHRLRNLEWIFLGEVCDELVDKVNQKKEEIARRLMEVGREDLANAVKQEFELLIEDVREAFLIRHMEKTRSLAERNPSGLFDQQPPKNKQG